MGYHNGVSTRLDPTNGSSTFSTLDPAFKRGGTLQFERRVTLLSLLAGLPAVALCALLLWLGDYSTRTQLTIDLFLVLGWLVVAFKLKERIVRPLQTLSNILAALREGDYSLRGRRAAIGDALVDALIAEIAAVRFRDVPSFAADDLSEDLRRVLDRLHKAGIARAVAVDLTRPEFGISVVRLVIPGLEWDPHHPNYRPGRRAEAMAAR